MGMKIDRFTWSIILIVLLLIAGAIVMVTASGGRGWTTDDYLNEDTPAAVVHDAFVAFVRNEPAIAANYYSAKVLADDENKASFAERVSYYDSNRQNQRLRILKVDINDDTAYVTLAIDRFRPGGLFDSGSTWTDRRTIPLVREEGAWKIDTETMDLFY